MKMVGSEKFWVRTQNIWVRHHGIIVLVAEKANSLNKEEVIACILSVNLSVQDLIVRFCVCETL